LKKRNFIDEPRGDLKRRRRSAPAPDGWRGFQGSFKKNTVIAILTKYALERGERHHI
jgi:hypothetical protein